MADAFESAPIVDCGQSVDVFAQSIARIENLGSCSRLHFTSHGTEQNGEKLRTVVARIVVPNEMLPYIIAALRCDSRILERHEASFRDATAH